jgi:hypothetical protein
MKKILATVAAIAMAASMISTPAQAGSKNTALILGGLIGGLIVADIIKESHAKPRHRPTHIEPRHNYHRRSTVYCWDEPRSYWSDYHRGYVTKYVQRCEYRR